MEVVIIVLVVIVFLAVVFGIGFLLTVWDEKKEMRIEEDHKAKAEDFEGIITRVFQDVRGYLSITTFELNGQDVFDFNSSDWPTARLLKEGDRIKMKIYRHNMYQELFEFERTSA